MYKDYQLCRNCEHVLQEIKIKKINGIIIEKTDEHFKYCPKCNFNLDCNLGTSYSFKTRITKYLELRYNPKILNIFNFDYCDIKGVIHIPVNPNEIKYMYDDER